MSSARFAPRQVSIGVVATVACFGTAAAMADEGAGLLTEDVPLCMIGQGLAGGAGVEGGAVGPLPIAVTFLEMEPNDTFELAETIIANSLERTAIEGAINAPGDVDFYSFPMNQGDVVQFFVENLSNDQSLQLIHYDSMGDAAVIARTPILSQPTFVAPTAPFVPAPDNGFGWDNTGAALTWVVQETGDVTIEVSTDFEFGSASTGNYRLHVTRVRTPIDSAPHGTRLTVFLDFDGAMIHRDDIYNPTPGPDPLSPLADFLEAWELDLSDESALIDAIVAEFTEHVAYLESFNPNFDFEIRNSRDHADPFGDPFVTRLIIGGTRDELGVNVIGIAESIDVGDFAPNQTAFVLLDIMSSQTSSSSVNNLALAPGVSKIEAVAQAVAAVSAHELGHNIGGVHTNHFNDVRSVMDTTGLARNLMGIGADEILGTKDDELVRFALDEYVGSSSESEVEGLEPTQYIAAVAFSTPAGCAADLTGDGFINGADLAALLANWGPTKHAADFNGDGFVNGADLAALLAVWGVCE